MGTLLMRQASSFLKEKYNAARLALTDVSETEIWVENVTNNSVWSPNTKIMTQIAEASYNFNDYWKIVDALHKRFNHIDWKKWRQSYNSLVLLEFLITHGHVDFAMEFRCDIEVIKELGRFKLTDNRGVNWGMFMRNKVQSIMTLMEGGPSLQEARSKAIKLTTEIHGFGSTSSTSPTSTSSPPSSWRSSFDSYSPTSPLWHDINHESKIKYIQEIAQDHIIQHKMPKNFLDDGVTISDMLDLYTNPEIFSEINLNEDSIKNINNNERGVKKGTTFFQSICSKHIGWRKNGGKILFRSITEVGRENKKMLDHKYQ